MTIPAVLPIPESTYQLLLDAYAGPADPGRFDEVELTAWATTTIDEPAARAKIAGFALTVRATP